MRRRLVSFCASTILLASGFVFAQENERSGALRNNQNRAVSAHDHQHTLAREKWQLTGRKLWEENSAVLRDRAIQQKLRMRAARTVMTGLSGTRSSVAGVWVSLGPSPLPSDASGTGLQDYNWVSGRATAVAVDPNDGSGNTVFAGGAYGGIWKSSNAGSLSQNPSAVTWTPLTDNQATLAIGSIAVQPQAASPNPANSVVLAGTGETDSSTDSYYGLGILRSSTGGQSWTLITQDSTGAHSFAGLGFSQIAFSGANPNLVVAAAGAASEGILEGLENPVGVNRGLYYSTDAGVNWQIASVTDSGAIISTDSATAVGFNPASATDTTAPQFYAGIRFHGFYSSPDGVNWTRLPNQPGNGLTSLACPSQAASPSACPIYRGEIAFVPNRAGPSNLGEMYVWYVDANDVDQGIWSSVDGGLTWTQIDDSGITNCGDLFGGCGTEQGIFSLTLSAVPDGDGTDLYAGAVNIYKCAITSASSTCSGTGSNSFINLTHAYGCSDIAKVHPGQHAMSFAVANGSAFLYFANDGGIYRALDGYTGLTTGTCGQTNQFDSLNQTLGPMTQFVSVAESASDANVIFGGTQDNGAPATAFSQSGGNWVNVDAGDNGFSAINPSNEDEWFVSTPPDAISGVNLFRCAIGIGCHTADFKNDQVVDSGALDGDTGGFYLPFLLDPQNPGELILGTCRIWRGPSTGGSFSLLSPDFETGGTGSCSGDEINLVRSIAAGGVKDPSAFSQVIYAGTNGEGPLISTVPTGGHVWVTANADSGPLSWSDVTQAINPQGYPVSSIALDSTDPLGKTAYLTIMGFHTAHVWKTTDAGNSWTDFTANLPDAPANTVIVDSGSSLTNGVVYVGTDVGVFATSTGTPNWTEVGPASGQAGFLPNVAVSSLQIFNSGGLHRLRAATYGRGIWELNLVSTPDYDLTISNPSLTAAVNNSATFNGKLSAIDGYNSSVAISCGAGAPPSCSVIPSSANPTSAGTAFTVEVSSNAAQTYNFNIVGVGSDTGAITHSTPVTFTSTSQTFDFTLGITPQSATVQAGQSTNFTVAVNPNTGSFPNPVTFSCSGLPQLSACSFNPSQVDTGSGNSQVMMNISTTGPAPSSSGFIPGTPAGTYSIAVTATSGSVAHNLQLSLTVTPAPFDFNVGINPAAGTVQAGQTISFNVAVNPNTASFPNSVTFSCSGLPNLTTFNFTPSSVSSGTGNATVTLNVITTGPDISNSGTIPGTAAGSYSITITATSGSVSHNAGLTLTVVGPSQTFDFNVGVNPVVATVAAGQTVVITTTVSSTTGAFPGSVSFSCSGLPALSTCSFGPFQLSSDQSSGTSMLSISTTAAVAASSVSFGPLFSVVPLTALMFVKRLKTRISFRRTLFAVVLALGAWCISCGGGLQGNSSSGRSNGSGSPGTPPGTYTVSVSVTCSSESHAAPLTFTVTPQ